MKNYEKYADKIREYNSFSFCDDFIKPYILKSDDCFNNCSKCGMVQVLWLLEEYEEPEIDWSQIEVNTPILVRDSENEEWMKRYFAECKYGTVYAWIDGRTSLTENYMESWKYIKLAEDKENLEIDWSKVEVDTPILVRQGKNGEWLKRHFAKYENGLVYAWKDSRTSWTAYNMMTAWECAKLAESEEGCTESETIQGEER